MENTTQNCIIRLAYSENLSVVLEHNYGNHEDAAFEHQRRMDNFDSSALQVLSAHIESLHEPELSAIHEILENNDELADSRLVIRLKNEFGDVELKSGESLKLIKKLILKKLLKKTMKKTTSSSSTTTTTAPGMDLEI